MSLTHSGIELTAEKAENIAATAHREVREETGLDGRIIDKLGHIEYFYTVKEGGPPRRVFKTVYFFLMEYQHGDVADHDDEVDECRWVPIGEAISLMRFKDEKDIIEKARRRILEIHQREIYRRIKACQPRVDASGRRLLIIGNAIGVRDPLNNRESGIEHGPEHRLKIKDNPKTFK